MIFISYANFTMDLIMGCVVCNGCVRMSHFIVIYVMACDIQGRDVRVVDIWT